MPQVKIDKLIFGGQAMGRIDSKIAFVWGALPGEEVEFSVAHHKKNFLDGSLTQVITSSPNRIEPVEGHYLCCSPWQTMSVESELAAKVSIAQETFARIGKFTVPNLDIVGDNRIFGYRNKLEYSFVADADGLPLYGFHLRGSHRATPIQLCQLGSSSINKSAQVLLDWLRENKIPRTALKSVIVRSNLVGETLVALFVKEPLVNQDMPPFDSTVKSFQIYFSNPLSPASVPTKLLYNTGDNFLIETLRGRKFKYGPLSFFQINPPVFEQALADMEPFVNRAPTIIVDYYAGVGSIGLSLSQKNQSCVIVENNSEAANFATENAQRNGLSQVQIIPASIENELSYITPEATVIVDPPRAGLDKKVIAALLRQTPSKIIYLSCDLATQARDVALLLPSYSIKFQRLYNFFPRTPHTEGLCVLERIGHP